MCKSAALNKKWRVVGRKPVTKQQHMMTSWKTVGKTQEAGAITTGCACERKLRNGQKFKVHVETLLLPTRKCETKSARDTSQVYSRLFCSLLNGRTKSTQRRGYKVSPFVGSAPKWEQAECLR